MMGAAQVAPAPLLCQLGDACRSKDATIHAPTKLDGSIHVAASGQSQSKSQSKTGAGLRTIMSEIVFTLGDKGKHLEEYEFFESEPVLVDHILNVRAVPSLFRLLKSLSREAERCNIDGASANAATSCRIEGRASDLHQMQRRPDAHLPASGLGAHYSSPSPPPPTLFSPDQRAQAAIDDYRRGSELTVVGDAQVIPCPFLLHT